MEDVAITGMGVVSPFGTGVPRFLGGMLAGPVTIQAGPPGPEGPGPLRSVVPNFDPSGVLGKKVMEGSEVFAQFALIAAIEAVEQSGLQELHPRRTAIAHGSSMGGSSALLRAQHQLEAHGADTIDRKLMIQIWPNMAAAQIAMRWDLHGPQLTLCHACASSIDAIGMAAKMIARGEVDVALAGGTEGGSKADHESPDGDFVPATQQAGKLYKMNSAQPDPTRAIQPFDRDRTGIVGGEGSAMFVLESGRRARARGAEIFAYVRGHGSLADGYHPSSPEPTGRWERQVMEDALDDARLLADEIGALVAHATGTPAGDAAEIRALNGLFKRSTAPLPVMSIKGTVGHTGAASGGMGVIVGTNALRNGVLPSTMSTQNVDPEVEFTVALGEPIAVQATAVQVNAFGFGGQNASLVIGK